ncbi:MAG: hypothetical protein IPH88_19845 [Bacteroidales bacterium]|nr:hypothetical protein [Bacteroidales bacterium]
MNLRIEFTNNRSPTFQRVLEICRGLNGYTEKVMPWGTVYAVTFNDDEIWSAEAVRDMVHKWNGTAYYINGKLVSRLIGFRFIWDEARKEWERVMGAQKGYAFDPLKGPDGGGVNERLSFAKNIIAAQQVNEKALGMDPRPH